MLEATEPAADVDIAQDPGTPEWVLAHLATSSSASVRAAVASRGAELPESVREVLLRDQDQRVANAAAKRSRQELQVAWSMYREGPSPVVVRSAAAALVVLAIGAGVGVQALPADSEGVTAMTSPTTILSTTIVVSTTTVLSTTSVPTASTVAAATTLAATTTPSSTTTTRPSPSPVKNLTAKIGKGKLAVSWDHPSAAEFEVVIKSGGEAHRQVIGRKRFERAVDPGKVEVQVRAVQSGVSSKWSTDTVTVPTATTVPATTVPPTTQPVDDCPFGDYTGDPRDGECGQLVTTTAAPVPTPEPVPDPEPEPEPEPDYCPGGDYSGSEYDGTCGNPPTTTTTSAPTTTTTLAYEQPPEQCMADQPPAWCRDLCPQYPWMPICQGASLKGDNQ